MPVSENQVPMSTPMTGSADALGWVSVRHLKHIIARGEAAGLRMDELIDEAGLARARLVDADGLVPVAVLEGMLTAFARRYSDPLMGLHLAEDIQPATFGVLGYISQSCATFADVLDAVSRYRGLLSNIGESAMSFEPGSVVVSWRCLAGSPFFRRQATEYVLGVLVTLSRLLLPENAHFPQAVHFAHSRPDGADAVREYFEFFRCPVYFDRPQSCLVMPTATLKIRMRYSDAFMKDVLDRHARDIIRRREHSSSLPDEVRHLIGAMIIEGVPAKEAVAMQLGTSARSLHRNLQELGTGYREILDEVRLSMACERLHESDDTVSAIAGRLGFLSHQAFLRWFRKSTGTTPGEYRRLHRKSH